MRIIVLGAGPAGATTALGLKRLGFQVVVVSERRRFLAIEGISQRVVDGLRQAGLTNAVAQVAPASPRYVLWSGQWQVLNQEFLVDRERFDAGIQEDLREAGVEIIEARARQIDSTTAGHRVQIEPGGVLHGDFLVEARGRQAPLHGRRVRGPETVSLLNYWQGEPGLPAASGVESLADGWSWMASMGDGQCYWQITLDAGRNQLPPKSQLADYCALRRRQSLMVQKIFGESANRSGAVPFARSSTAVLFQEICGSNWIRIGDAAMAVDPLSGNGIFQSLSSSLQAPAVVNTILTQPQHSVLARRFHQQRVEHLFYRFARTGRDFYALAQQWAHEPFWESRGQWPDSAPIHHPADPSRLSVARAPVIRGELIDEVDVVVTADQPLGVWHIQGVELAPIVRRLEDTGSLEDALGGLTGPQRSMVSAWLHAQGYKE